MGLGGVPYSAVAPFQMANASTLDSAHSTDSVSVRTLPIDTRMGEQGTPEEKSLARSSSAPPYMLDQLGSESHIAFIPGALVVDNGEGKDLDDHRRHPQFYEPYFSHGNRSQDPLLGYNYSMVPKKAGFTNDPKMTVGASIRQPMPRPAPRNVKPGAIGERVRNASYGELPEASGGAGGNMLSKSVADRIQEDFPRTPSPAIALGRRAAMDPARLSKLGPEAELEALNAGSYQLGDDHAPEMRIPSPLPLHRASIAGRSRNTALGASVPRGNTFGETALHNSFNHGINDPVYGGEFGYPYHSDSRPGASSDQMTASGNSVLQGGSYSYSNSNIGLSRVPLPMTLPTYDGAYGPEAFPPGTSSTAQSEFMVAMLTQHQMYTQQLAQMVAANAAVAAISTGPHAGPSGYPGHQSLGSGHGRARAGGAMNTWEIGLDGNAIMPLSGRFSGRRTEYGTRTGRVGVSDGAVGRRGGPRRGRRGNEELPQMARYGGNSFGGMVTTDNPLPRSPLLEEFRATSLSVGRISMAGDGSTNVISSLHGLRDWKLSEIREHVVEFATDQHGSRFIQQKLESALPDEVEAVLQESLNDVHRLMTDVFGNYVVQKLLDYGGEFAIRAILQELREKMLVLSLHMYGCRVVQKALEVLDGEARSQLVNELDGHVLKCIRDQNGNHVIQKCIELVPAENIQFIVDAVVGQAVMLAEHSYGCRVVQRILENGSGEQKAPIMEEIMESVQELIKDQYGNYVIQHVVEHGTIYERTYIIDIVQKQVCALSQHKFASNVVERCLTHGTLEQRRTLIEILISGDHPAEGSPLNQLVRDQFGNYVVQRVLDEAEPSQRERVVNILKNQVTTIKKYSYGKHIIARLEAGWGKTGGLHVNPLQGHSESY
eukprot:CAMPEP_0184682188 /NCGR_PEP_ID=MMETSP0312-20130426/6276_1 /TAXON_ID=31354 /ORGANISM="Compsopogon coeruleus, Strain SAG 36.94" /LENGTH=884 /DNA_ID=CAMNT_0027133679 /DNA_START=847 /DNA_END=3501 /DNA_ORIENTATION=+